jgi:hypothetical protein
MTRYTFRCVAGVVLVLLALVPCAAQAESGWTLTTADFKTRAVDVVAIDDGGAKVAVEGGAQSVVPWQEILQIARVPSAAPLPRPNDPASRFTLYLAGGDRITGTPGALEGETFSWSAPSAGKVDVTLKRVLAVTRGGDAIPRRDEKHAAEDVVALANGDFTRGLISAIDANGITVQADGNPITVSWDAVKSVLLAAVASSAEPANNERGVRITLADGSILSGRAFTLAGDKAALAAADGAQRDLAAASVTSIEQLNGPVAWLSSLPPSENVQTPFLETVFPARMDRTVVGEPIRFGDRTFARGIGVHAYSRMTWQLPEGNRYESFRTRYAVDGDKPYANVTVRVKLDDKVVHEAQDFVAGKLADVVQVPLGNAKTLTLEVDYGKTYDVQDRFNWIEPALLAE